MPTAITTRQRRCVGDLPRLLLAVTARTVLWSVLLLALWSVLPTFMGWQVTTVVSGSMAPAIRTGDVVAAMPTGPDAVTPGRVLLVEDPDHDDRLRLHRLQRVEQDGSLRLRGDANPSADRTTVAPDAVLGIGILRFPGVGLPRVWIGEQAWSNLIAVGFAAAAALLLARFDRPIVLGEPCRRCGAPRWDLRTTPRSSGDPRRTSGPVAIPLVAGAVAVLVGLTTAFSGASFSGTTSSAAVLGSTEFGCFHQPTGDAVLAWDFAEKNGARVVDVSGHGFDGELAPQSPRIDGSCAHNPYATFEALVGRAGAVHATTSQPAPSTFSVQTWFRTDRIQGRIVGFGNYAIGGSTSFDRHLYIGADGTLMFGVHDGSTRQAVGSTSSVTDGQWHHAVGQFAPGRMELWVDGTMVDSRSDVARASAYTGYWRAGYDNTTSWPNRAASHYFLGSVDTIRVHDRMLTGTEIASAAAARR